MKTNENITPSQFIERWVPGTLQEWENVYRREIAGRGYTQEEKAFEKHRYIFAKFAEALAAFEDHIRGEVANTPKSTVDLGQLEDCIDNALDRDFGAIFEARIRAETWREACEIMRLKCAAEAATRIDEYTQGDYRIEKHVRDAIFAAPIPRPPKNQ